MKIFFPMKTQEVHVIKFDTYELRNSLIWEKDH